MSGKYEILAVVYVKLPRFTMPIFEYLLIKGHENVLYALDHFYKDHLLEDLDHTNLAVADFYVDGLLAYAEKHDILFVVPKTVTKAVLKWLLEDKYSDVVFYCRDESKELVNQKTYFNELDDIVENLVVL
jgi:hypothetical protein